MESINAHSRAGVIGLGLRPKGEGSLNWYQVGVEGLVLAYLSAIGGPKCLTLLASMTG